MARNREIVILRAYRPFLKSLTIYKLENFRTNDRQLLIQNIFHAIGLTVVFAVFIFIFLPTQFLACCNEDLREVVRPFSFFLAIAPAMLIYFIMRGKTDKIVDTLDYLHKVVVESECMLFISVFIFRS